MKSFASLTLLTVVLTCQTYATTTNHDNKLNDRPIIAVLAELCHPAKLNQSYIAASYVKYLESAGARVVPIPHYWSESEVAEMFTYVNGVLYPGGGITWFTSGFYKHAKQFWDLAIKANDKGNYFPIWGTCLGFETLHVVRTGKKVLSRRKSSDRALALNFTKNAKKSRLLRNAPADIYAALGTEKVTYNHHSWGITQASYKRYSKLRDFFKILSLNMDSYGYEFISTVEAYKYPIYGTQWHPEKNNFEFTTLYKEIPHSANAVKVSQYMANFFVNEARKNFQKFPSKEMENKYLIYNHQPVHSAKVYKTGTLSHFEQVYLFQGRH